MPSWFERVLSSVGLQRAFNPFTPAEWQALANGFNRYPMTTYGKNEEPISTDFESLVASAYASNPVVFAAQNARVQLFSEARFQYQKLVKGRPGELWSDGGLGILEQPFPGGTTSMMLKDALIDADFGGNAFIIRKSATELRRLRPDWVTMISGNPARREATIWDTDTQFLGIGYQPGGPRHNAPIEYFPIEQVCHFKTTHDPLRRFSGMPWVLTVLRELSSDQAATAHKQKYWENAATPNMAVMFDQTMTAAQAKDWIKLFREDHEGASNAYKTLFLGGGATMQPIGANLRQSDFSDVTSASELRIASAANVPPIVIGVKGGLDAATYSNYGQARRAFADLFARPTWRDFSGAMQRIVPAPAGNRLWFDDRDISFLQEDVMDAAEIRSRNALTMESLIRAGYTPDSARDAVVSGDFQNLKHTGLYSVQLQPPGTTAAPAPALPSPEGQDAKPALLNSGPVAGEVRCQGCHRLLAELAAAPYRLRCARCKTLNESGNLIAA